MPADTNPYGGVFGGWLMSQMALAAGSLASRHSRGKAVVVAADALTFPGVPTVGDEISVYAELVREGRSSMRIAVQAVARERDGDGEIEVASGEFTFVALGDDDRPREIPPHPAQAAPESPSPSREEGISPSPLEGEGGARPAKRDGRVRGYDDRTLNKAKSLRRDLTDVERRLWNVLRSRQFEGAKFRRQQPIGPFIVDFVCQQHRLIVEADGGQHDAAKDAPRTAFIESVGYRVLRFWNNDIIENIDGVTQSIATALATPHPARAAHESPSPSRGEGSFGASHV